MLHSMGVGQRKLVPFWVLALALTCSQHTGKIQSVQLFQAIWRDIFLPPCPGLRWAVSFRVLSGKLKVSVSGSCYAALARALTTSNGL